MPYRQTRAYRLALIAATVQRRALVHRVATLENTRAPAVAIRKRRVAVQS